MRTKNRKNDRKNRLKRYLKAKYGMKYDKGGKTGEGNPPEADFLLKRDPLADYDRETVGVAEGARGIGTLGTTTASDEARRQMSFLVPPEGMEEIREDSVPEGRPRPDRVLPLRRLDAGPLPLDMDREIREGFRVVKKEDPEGSFEMLYGIPRTENIRAYVSDLEGKGRRAFGFRGYTPEEKEAYRLADRVPYGFRMNGTSIAASPEALEMLRERGVGARGQLTEDSLRELYDSNPEMFGTGAKAASRTTDYLNRMAMEEAKRGLTGDTSKRYYIPTI